MSRPFRFKQFGISQEHAPFKVGTDGVSLGAWAGQHSIPKQILDIGTGTGLIAIMLAQRFENATVCALEINSQAVGQARKNINACPWSERIELVHDSLHSYSPDVKFDLIACNPPYFKNSLQNNNSDEAQARHESSLELEDLPRLVKPLLATNGKLAVIIPADRYQDLVQAANQQLLYSTRVCHIVPTPNQLAKRVMIEFNAVEQSCQFEELLLEEERHQYSEAYRSLTKDFLLKH